MYSCIADLELLHCQLTCLFSERETRAPTSRLLQYGTTEVESHITAAPLDPNWRPLANASQEARDRIWANILRLAMSPLSPGTQLARPPLLSPGTWGRVRAGLVQVCKEFNVSVGFIPLDVPT
jgi:hypothetical protein